METNTFYFFFPFKKKLLQEGEVPPISPLPLSDVLHEFILMSLFTKTLFSFSASSNLLLITGIVSNDFREISSSNALHITLPTIVAFKLELIEFFYLG